MIMNDETLYKKIIEELPKCDVISVTSEPVFSIFEIIASMDSVTPK